MAYFTWLGTDAENQKTEQEVETHLETLDENQPSLAVFSAITISTCKLLGISNLNSIGVE